MDLDSFINKETKKLLKVKNISAGSESTYGIAYYKPSKSCYANENSRTIMLYYFCFKTKFPFDFPFYPIQVRILVLSSGNHVAEPENDLTGLIWHAFQPGGRSQVEIDFALYLEGYSLNTSLGLNPAFRIR